MDDEIEEYESSSSSESVQNTWSNFAPKFVFDTSYGSNSRKRVKRVRVSEYSFPSFLCPIKDTNDAELKDLQGIYDKMHKTVSSVEFQDREWLNTAKVSRKALNFEPKAFAFPSAFASSLCIITGIEKRTSLGVWAHCEVASCTESDLTHSEALAARISCAGVKRVVYFAKQTFELKRDLQLDLQSKSDLELDFQLKRDLQKGTVLLFGNHSPLVKIDSLEFVVCTKYFVFSACASWAYNPCGPPK